LSEEFPNYVEPADPIIDRAEKAEAELAECRADRDRLRDEIVRFATAYATGGLGLSDAMKQVSNLAAALKGE
jgi:hypothetical protein